MSSGLEHKRLPRIFIQDIISETAGASVQRLTDIASAPLILIAYRHALGGETWNDFLVKRTDER